VAGKADPAVELGIAGHPLLDAGHADEDQTDVGAVEPVTDIFQGRGGQALGLIDDQQIGEVGPWIPGKFGRGVEVLLDAEVHPDGPPLQVVAEFAQACRDGRGIEHLRDRESAE
jgi:hypothetical protein